MARYTESVCKLCRNEGVKLFLKAGRCYTTKCAIERRHYASGQHGQERKKPTEYAIQLREKQKLRNMYGILETKFSSYFEKASRQKKVPTGLRLLQLLESRFDNIVHKSGLIPSRAMARQLILHGHFLVDGKKVNIPSYPIRPEQVISVTDKARKLIKTLLENSPELTPPVWMNYDKENMTISITRMPERDELDPTIKEAFIVEYYSR